MAVQKVDAVSNADMNNTVNSATNRTLDKEAFLQLLVTQLRYQDPLDPQDNAEYIAQLAQFSALEQMTNVAEGLSSVLNLVDNIDTSLLVGQLTSMIGQGVQWNETIVNNDGENSTSVTTKYEGTIKAVSISDGAPSVVAVDKLGVQHKVLIGDITRIGSIA